MGCVAAIQMVSGADLDENLRQAAVLIQEAASKGAKLAVLPENFALLSMSGLRAAGERETSGDRPIQCFLSQQAEQHRIWLVGGSIPITTRPGGEPVPERVRAACLVYSPEGKLTARYDKIHLFDVDVADSFGSYRESDVMEPGDTPEIAETSVGRLGLSICYDVRFPELYRALLDQHIDLITVPAAFTAVTGDAHWETLLRARAVENICYVVGANQGGCHNDKRTTHGHSMIVDPWGRVVDHIEVGPGVVVADIDLGYLAELRASMPVAQHRRLNVCSSD